MNTTLLHRRGRCRQRGASLLEAMLAFVVLAAGTAGIGQLQGRLRLDADTGRQRAEALRLGKTELEALRTSGAAGEADTLLAPAADGTRYRLVRQTAADAFTGASSAGVRVQWRDRAGAGHEVGLDTIVARSDAAFAGALALGPGAVPAAARGAFGRAPAVPVEARDLGDGRSAWKPAAGGTAVLLFDNRSGSIVARCSVAAAVPTGALSAAALAACTTTRALLVSGTLRFASPAMPAASLALTLVGGHDPAAAECHSEARKTVRFDSGGSLRVEAVGLDALPASVGAAAWYDTGERFIAWSCAVAPRDDGAWSGHAELAGAGPAQLCRFGRPGESVVEGEAGNWRDIAEPRQAQDFLVAAVGQACPAALAAFASRP